MCKCWPSFQVGPSRRVTLSAVGAAWTDPFQTLLLVGGVSTFVDSRVIATECAFAFSYYFEIGFFFLIPFATVVFAALVHVCIFVFKAYIVPCFCIGEDIVGKTLTANFLSYYL